MNPAISVISVLQPAAVDEAPAVAVTPVDGAGINGRAAAGLADTAAGCVNGGFGVPASAGSAPENGEVPAGFGVPALAGGAPKNGEAPAVRTAHRLKPELQTTGCSEPGDPRGIGEQAALALSNAAALRARMRTAAGAGRTVQVLRGPDTLRTPRSTLHAPRSTLHPAPALRAGFSLIGFIGLLALVAVIATLAAPSIIKQSDRTAWTRETADLQSFSNALVLSITRAQSIPDVGTLAQRIGQEMALPLSGITVTPRGLSRAFVYNPSGWLGTQSLPYSQTPAGLASRPAGATLMILSTIAVPLPTSLGDFNILWNTAEGSVPASWSGWSGKGEDLRFHRVDLSPLFHKLLLVNADRNAPGPYAIEDGGVTTVATLSQAQAFFLQGTRIKLFYANGALQARELLLQDASFTFQNGRWGRELAAPKDVNGEFAWWVAQFLQPPAPPNPKFAATQQAVVSMLYYYLWGYAVWAGTPPGLQTWQTPGGVQNYPPYAALTATPNGYQVSLSDFCNSLISQ